MARPWESALHVDPTCLDHNLSSTGTSIGPLNDRLPRSERLTRTTLSVSESSSTRTFSFRRHTNLVTSFGSSKNVVCMCNIPLVDFVWVVVSAFLSGWWVDEFSKFGMVPSCFSNFVRYHQCFKISLMPLVFSLFPSFFFLLFIYFIFIFCFT